MDALDYLLEAEARGLLREPPPVPLRAPISFGMRSRVVHCDGTPFAPIVITPRRGKKAARIKREKAKP